MDIFFCREFNWEKWVNKCQQVFFLYRHCVICNIGAVSAEMFRQMQNSEIIRKMTEEFDEVMGFDILSIHKKSFFWLKS